MKSEAFMRELINWINNNIEGRLDLDTVSERAGYSKWHLQRMFKEHTGHPLGEYIRSQKLKKSADRLTSSNEPLRFSPYTSSG